ncbi:MAG: methionine--tRNA ligase [Weeping tea tree witches'-broom phytoplasma]|uniref:methionine--tRNA ligase n=1 Tax=Candidatus Phytoplasma melaleucae TaxID=2982630 RepID=UPI00293A5574|nr:methionine--tRNA ligase [Weeping tea tree witches'-broom phytoplasma]
MNMIKKKFFIATSIVYASSLPHIGNVYEMILADSIARFKKLDGYDVYFQTGTDEHGQKIEKKAARKNINAQAYVNHISTEIKRIYDSLNIQYDYFIRTTSLSHKQNVQIILEKLFAQGDIYKGLYEGWYSVSEESYVSEKDLIDHKMPNGESPIWTKEEVYFFKISKYQDKLLKYLEENPYLILPIERRKEIFNLLKTPLTDLAISRTSFRWGIPLSFNPKHITYVWIDALSNYITGLNDELNFNVFNINDKFRKYWPCDLHVIGKDISKFHLIYYPILLMSLNLPLPKQFLIHPWILFNEKKMSKSTNNVVYTDDLLQIFPSDAIRYFVLSKIPSLSDGILTYDLFYDQYNADLANTIGNLLSRSLGMIKSYRNNQLTKILIKEDLGINLSQKAVNTLPLIRNCMLFYQVNDALAHIIKLARSCNKYIDMVKPWNLAKVPCSENNNKLDFCLYNLVETLRFIGVLLKPFLPVTAKLILKYIQSEENTFSSLKKFGITRSKIMLQADKKLFERLRNPNLIKTKNI